MEAPQRLFGAGAVHPNRNLDLKLAGQRKRAAIEQAMVQRTKRKAVADIPGPCVLQPVDVRSFERRRSARHADTNAQTAHRSP